MAAKFIPGNHPIARAARGWPSAPNIKPSVAAKVNRDHPLADGLAGVYLFSASNNKNLLTGESVTFPSAGIGYTASGIEKTGDSAYAQLPNLPALETSYVMGFTCVNSVATKSYYESQSNGVSFIRQYANNFIRVYHNNIGTTDIVTVPDGAEFNVAMSFKNNSTGGLNAVISSGRAVLGTASVNTTDKSSDFSSFWASNKWRIFDNDTTVANQPDICRFAIIWNDRVLDAAQLKEVSLNPFAPYGIPLLIPANDTPYLIGVSGGTTPVSVGLIGNSSASAVGTITASAVQNTTIALTGLSSTTAFGSLTATTGQSVSHTLTGVFASSALGTLTSNAEVNVIIGLTGNSSTTGIGTLTVLVGGGVSTALTGLSSTTALGTLSVDAANNVSVALTGNDSTTALGTLSVTVGTQIALSGVSSSSAIGTLIANTEQQINYPLTGLFSTGSVGTLTITVPATVSLELTGISITSGIGALSVSVPTSTDWTPVTNSETIWSDISDSSTTWTEI